MDTHLGGRLPNGHRIAFGANARNGAVLEQRPAALRAGQRGDDVVNHNVTDYLVSAMERVDLVVQLDTDHEHLCALQLRRGCGCQSLAYAGALVHHNVWGHHHGHQIVAAPPTRSSVPSQAVNG